METQNHLLDKCLQGGWTLTVAIFCNQFALLSSASSSYFHLP